MYRTTPISHDCSRSYPAPQTVADMRTVHVQTLFLRSHATLQHCSFARSSHSLSAPRCMYQIFSSISSSSSNCLDLSSAALVISMSANATPVIGWLTGTATAAPAGTACRVMTPAPGGLRLHTKHTVNAAMRATTTAAAAGIKAHTEERRSHGEREERRASLQSGGTHRQQ